MALRRASGARASCSCSGGALLLTYVRLCGRSACASRSRPARSSCRRSGGKTVNEATALLTEAGLNLKVEEGRRLDPKVPAGQILSQEPQPGVRTRRERSVKVWVSAGPRSTIVPALQWRVGADRAAAAAAGGLELAGVAEIRSADYPAGTVVAQTPPPKSSAAAGGAARQPRRARRAPT